MRPDIIMLDLHMPKMDGFAVLDALRERCTPGEYLPIVVLTADTTQEAKERALSNGANDFLIKPIERVEVLLRTRNLLETAISTWRSRTRTASSRRSSFIRRSTIR